MFNRNTLFIVGAGASKEAGLPIGTELTERIAELLKISVDYRDLKSGDHVIYEAMKRLAQSGPPWNNNKFLASGREVAEAMDLAVSIDTFLETHASNCEYVMLGKLGIVRAIWLEERASKLAPTEDRQKPFRMRDLGDTWYFSLARQLFTGIPVEQPERAFENVSFVVFNYDRCLQVFLLRALEVYFRLSRPRAEEILQAVPIIHPYGSLGSIFEGSENHMPYAPTRLDLIEAAGRIRTFSESAHSAAISTVRQLVDQAESWIFLGFGFHEQNIRLLDPGNVWIDDGDAGWRYRAFATACGLSSSDTQFVRDEISSLRTGAPENANGAQWIHTLNDTCNALFRSYWRSLTA